jgi:hypothetical protein
MKLPTILPFTSSQSRAFLLIALLGFIPSQVMALGYVRGTANASNIIVQNPHTVTVRWLISTGDSKGKIMSGQGVYQSINGLVLGVNNRGISGTASGVPNLTLSEGLAIPRTVITRATSMGLRSIVYQRSFHDSSGGGNAVGQVVFNLIS